MRPINGVLDHRRGAPQPAAGQILKPTIVGRIDDGAGRCFLHACC